MDLSLADLAEKAGVPARTIRYYISLNLLEGPVQGGRVARYTTAHLVRLNEIGKLQRRGLSLSEIAAHGKTGGRLPEPESAWRYPVAPGVVVEVRSGLSPWRMRQVQRLIAEMAARLESEEDGV